MGRNEKQTLFSENFQVIDSEEVEHEKVTLSESFKI